MSKFHEDEVQKKERDNNHPRGCAVATAQMLHSILKYPEVFTDLDYVNVPTLPLELCPATDSRKWSKVED
eukprot:8123318-Ditylum_brightwellii.AAC.1